jgi:hypothetical protein
LAERLRKDGIDAQLDQYVAQTTLSRDPKIDSEICALEGLAETMFAEICRKKDIAPALHEELLIVILMMRGRTRLSYEWTSAAEGAIVKESFRRLQLAKGKTKGARSVKGFPGRDMRLIKKKWAAGDET